MQTIVYKGKPFDARMLGGRIAGAFFFITSVVMIFCKVVFAEPQAIEDNVSPPAGHVEVSRSERIRDEILAYVPNDTYASNLSNKIVCVADDVGIDACLLASLVQTESGFDQAKISEAGAVGLGQLTDICAQELSCHNIHVDLSDADSNLRGTAQYLKMMLVRFDGDESLAVAAYNAGPSAVEEFKGIPPFNETITHVQRVLERRDNLLR